MDPMKLVGRKVLGHELRRRHVAVAAGVLFAFLLALAGDLLPEAGLRWGLARTLRGLGMVDVSIDDTDISLFGGRLTVRKMVAQPALGRALGIGDFDLKFRWRPLLDRRLVLDHVAVEGIDLEMRHEDGGFVLNGLPLAVAAQPPAEDGAASTPWGIDVAGLELTNSRLKLIDGEFVAEVAVERLRVENVNSLDPRRAVAFSLKGSLNGAPVSLSGTLRPFAAEPSFAIAVQAQGVPLAEFAVPAARAGAEGLAGTAELSLAAEGVLRAEAPDIKITGRLALEQAALAAPAAAKAERLELELDRLAWNGKRAEGGGRLRADAAAVALAGTKGSAGRLELDLGRLDWEDGKAGLADAALRAETLAVSAPGGGGSAGKLSLGLKTLAWDGTRLGLEGGRVEGAGLAGNGDGGEGAAGVLSLDAARLDWDGRRLGWQGGFTAAAAHVKVAGHDATPEGVEWAGRLDLDTAGPDGRAEGRLALKPLRLVVGDIRTVLRAAATRGKVEFGKATAAELSHLSVEGLAVSDTARNVDLAQVERIEADAPRLGRDGAVAVRRVSADKVNALRREGQGGFNWRIETRRLRLDQAERDADGDVALGEVRVDGLLARVNRGPDGLTGFDLDGKDRKRREPDKAAAEDAPDIRVGRLTVSDGRVNLRDRTMAETVRIDVTPLDLSVTGLDSGQPDRDSPFEIRASVGRGTIQAAGTVRPFADRISGRVDGKIAAFELPPLSPYLGEALGVQLQSGHFDGTLGVGADQGRLSGSLDVALSNLFIAQPDPDAPIEKKAGMPIETVLDLLRDGEDRIRLSLPIRGDAANPDIDVSDAVAQAVAGALKSTVLTTLKLAFPVAMLIEMAVDDSDKAHLALAPLGFAPGLDALTPENETILASVAELMKGRPGLRLTLCGKADHGDWPVVAARRRAADRPLLSRLEQLVGYERATEAWGPPDRNMLSALAQRRTEAVRNNLVDKGGIETGRLFGCRPMVEENGKGPRVELLL
jgi:hypothetical protein